MTKKNRTLGRGVQALEQKAMMAGDVAISVVDGNLFIAEGNDNDDAGAAQQIQIINLKGDKVRVQGLGKTDIDSLNIDGRSIDLGRGRDYVDVAVTGDITMNLGGGDDDVYFSSAGGGVTANQVLINTDGAGDDGDDYVSINGLTTRQELKINTHGGDDDVYVSNTTVGDSTWEDLEIKTGAGADNVRVTNSTVADDVDVDMYLNQWEADVDELFVSSVNAKDIKADMGNGADEAVVQFSNIERTVRLNMGDPNGGLNDEDYVYLGHNVIDFDVLIDGGDGDDVVRAAHNDVAGVFRFDGGDGLDQLFRYTENGGDTNEVGWYDINDAVFSSYGW